MLDSLHQLLLEVDAFPQTMVAVQVTGVGGAAEIREQWLMVCGSVSGVSESKKKLTISEWMCWRNRLNAYWYRSNCWWSCFGTEREMGVFARS